MLSEEQGCRVLEQAFTRRGYSIARNVPFDEGGVSFEIDGWDAATRVGFEFLTRSEGDHDDLTPDEMERLVAHLEAGALYILLIDEATVDDAEDLLFAADRFLDEVERRRDAHPAAVASQSASTTKVHR